MFGFFKREESMIEDDVGCLANLDPHDCGLVSFYRDRVEYLEQMVRKYKFDVLTGLMGKQDYLHRIENLFEDYKFSNTPFFFGLCDINNLHNINRKHGYHVGDGVIKRVATDLERFFQFHQIYRISGDEFAVLIRSYHITLDEIERKLHTIDDITNVVESSAGYESPRHMFKALDSKLTEKKKSEKRI